MGNAVYWRAFWESHREDLYDMYINKRMTSSQIGSIYGVNPSAVCDALHRFNIPVRHERYNACHSIKSDYSDDINTQEKAYVLGFIAADGHVSRRGVIMFTQHKKEEDILLKIRDELGSDIAIRNKKDRYLIMNIPATSLSRRLNEMGIGPRKTYALDIEKLVSHVPKDLERHFLRGLFDGDGSICIYKYPYFKKHTYHIGFTGLKNVCDYVQDALG